MTNSNTISRACVAIVIVLSILFAGGAPSVPSPDFIGIENTQIQTGSE